MSEEWGGGVYILVVLLKGWGVWLEEKKRSGNYVFLWLSAVCLNFFLFSKMKDEPASEKSGLDINEG